MMEYPPNFGKNADLKLGIKRLEGNRGSWHGGAVQLQSFI